MCKTGFFLFFTLLASAGVMAQNTVNFQLAVPAVKIKESQYHQIKVIDLRNDTTNLGQVKKGFFDRKAMVIPKPSLTDQLNLCFYNQAGTEGSTGQLVLLLQRVEFNAITVGTRDYGFFIFRASLFSQKNEQYQQIVSIDTVAKVSSAMGVTDTLFKVGSKLIRQLITDHISAASGGVLYSYHDILHIDSVRKLAMKLYHTETYADGLYLTYKSFMNQTPDKQITVELNDVNYGVVRAADANGKTHRVNVQKVYALVYRGQPYISSRGMYYPLTKKAGDLYFTGEVQVSEGFGSIVLASSFGALGAAIGAANSEATFYVKIDPIDGQFIKIREIKDTPVIPANTSE